MVYALLLNEKMKENLHSYGGNNLFPKTAKIGNEQPSERHRLRYYCESLEFGFPSPLV